MASTANDIIRSLEREILPLQGFKNPRAGVQIGFKPIEAAFPNGLFPTAAVHEFFTKSPEDFAATAGFLSGLLASLMQQGNPAIWIGSTPVFPNALAMFNIAPENIIFINPKTSAEALWCIEQALHCNRLAAVVGELKQLSLNDSRRLQLAVEKSSVTGLLIRNTLHIAHTAAISRWQVTMCASSGQAALPGVGFPRWNVELLKVRNGKPGKWQIQWSNGRFNQFAGLYAVPQKQLKKTG